MKHPCNEFLRHFTTDLKPGEKKVCDKEISAQEVILVRKSFSKDKSPGNDGLAKELYESFWEEPTQPFMNSLNQAKVSKKLVTSQRQAEPISLLSVD